MPRCAICDYSSDLDPKHKQEVRWYDRAQEYRCQACNASIFQAAYGEGPKWRGNGIDLNGEVPTLDDSLLEPAEILVEPDVEGHQIEDLDDGSPG